MLSLFHVPAYVHSVLADLLSPLIRSVDFEVKVKVHRPRIISALTPESLRGLANILPINGLKQICRNWEKAQSPH